VVSRRGLLLAGFAGGATILAGCGKDDVGGPPPAAEVLRRSRDAENALAFAARTQVSSERALLRQIAQRAEGRAGRATAALVELSGRSAGSPEREEPVGDPLERGRAALEANVAALPSLSGRDLRELGVFLVEGSAADVALLEDVFGPVSGNAFPGTPA
jgi:hypothetical protein